MLSTDFLYASPLLDTFCTKLGNEPAVLVRVDATEGSVPREAGAWMAVFAHTQLGTVGGGHLEYEAMGAARELLRQHTEMGNAQSLAGHAIPVQARRFALGPALGQCCGGVVHLRFEIVGSKDIFDLKEQLRTPASPLALFGGGHVGHALVRVLASLPFDLIWIDSRDGVFPPDAPGHVLQEHSDPPYRAVADLRPQSLVLIMSFSHAEDLDIVAACLQRQRASGDLPYIGLIGSKTKWATFRHRLTERGFTPAELANVTCPIGVEGITRKEPEVIAVAVAAQLLCVLDRL